MAAQNNLLFPDLPPELRHTIYANLSSPYDPALTTSLPIKLKTFSCRHTTIQITPVHHGSASLLALQAQNYLEASEYAAWLLKNDITLQIGVVFKGRINTFVHADWAKKTEAHLRKLARAHPWLSKVGQYEVRIWWEPVDGVLKSSLRGGKKRRTAGMVVKDMLRTLLSCMDGDVARRKGDIKVVLGIDHACVVEGVLKGVHLGVGDLVDEKWRGVKRVGVKVVKGEGKKKEDGDGVEKKRFVPVEKEIDKVMMEVEGEQVMWVDMGATKVNLA